MKKFIQYIYGMQYEELEQKGKDGNKARLNGNLFIAAYLFVVLLLVVLLLLMISPSAGSPLQLLGSWNGQALGKLLAVPVFAILYGLTAWGIGTEKKFQKYVKAYKQLSEAEKKRSLQIVIVPFMGMLALMLILAFSRF